MAEHPRREWQKTVLEEAVEVLRMDLVKQPLLSLYHTSEEWKEKLLPILTEAGYLSEPYDINGVQVRDVLLRARDLIRPPETIPSPSEDG